MEEKTSFNNGDEEDFGDLGFTSSDMLGLEEEGLGNDLEVGYISDDVTNDERDNRFDETAVLNHNLAHENKREPLGKQISNRTVSSISSAGHPGQQGLEKRISERSNYSIGSAGSIELAVSQSLEHSDENSHGISVSPAPSERGSWNGRRLEKELSGRSNATNTQSMRSPRSRKRGMFNSRKETSCSTHAEEGAALEELFVLVGEEHLHNVDVRKNKAGFVVHLEIHDAELDGPAPECIGLFSHLEVLILENCCMSGTFPLWVDTLYLLQVLSLAHNQIAGFIPDSIANLQSLQELDLAGNQLSGSIPDSIGEIKTLTKLSLQHNDLSGIIPDSVCGLSLLTELNLSNCCISGHIPHHIGRMRALHTLLLFNNQLVGALPESLGDLSALVELNLCNNHFKGHLPESLGRLSLLSSLNLFHNEFNGSIPSSIGNLHSLRFLSLASNHFRGPFPEPVCNLTLLEQLNLSKNILSGQIPGAVERMPMLTALNLAYNRFKGSIPESICRLQRLTELHLDHNSLTGKIPEDIGNLAELTVITMTHNQLSGQIPVSIGSLTALTTVHLSSNQLTGVIPESLGGLVSLQTIHLSHNQLTGSIPESIVNLTALCELDLSFNRLSGPIPDGIVNLESLTEINLVDTYLSGYDTKKGVFLMSSCGIWAADQYGKKGISIVDFADWSPSYYRNAPLIARDHRKFQIPLSLISLFPHTLFLFPHEYLAKIFLDSSFYSHIRKAIFVFLRKVCEAQNPCIMHCLVILWYLLINSSKVHVSEEADLIEFADEVVRITNELFKCPSMDKLKNVQRLILEPQYCQPIQKNLDGTFDSVTYWNMAHIFENNSPIQFCLEHNHKFVLALTQITNITDQLFWGCVDTVPNNGKLEPCTPFEFSNTEYHSLTTYKVFACPRYTPAVMFFIEGLSKLYTLILVSFVCNFTYGQESQKEYSGSLAENLLVVILVAQVLYELGQLASCGWSLSDYFGGLWNILDVMSCMLLLFWLVLLPFPNYFYIGLGSIALSAIPLALLQLQYLSLIKTLGLLVLMIQSMMVDVLTFIIVYLVSIYGFTVSFRAMFYDVDSYGSTGVTFITLFQSTLGNFFFSDFDGTFTTVGQLLMVVFLVLTNVLLVNLLIAQMSSTYNRIIFKSREEWTFIKATYVQDNLLLSEKNPFCMLPPPLNMLTIGLYPLHVWALKNLNISVAGTAADYILGFYLFVPRFIFFWWKAVEAAFIDLEDDDDDYQERYHTLMKLLVLLFGKKITRLIVLLTGLPFGLAYALVSTVLRVLHVVVRVKPLDEDGDGSYEINFYLDAEEEDGSEAGDKENNKVALIKAPAGSPASSPHTATPYTFADAMPDAFAPVPDAADKVDGEEVEDPDAEDAEHDVNNINGRKPKGESKGAKRIKKALNKKQSFIIDPDLYDDPAALNSISPTSGPVRRTINSKPSNNKLLHKASFMKNSTTSNDEEGGGVQRKQSFSLFDIVSAGLGGSGGTSAASGGAGGNSTTGVKKMSPKTSFSLHDGLLKRLSPNVSFTLNDGASGAGGSGGKSSALSHKTSFNSDSSGRNSRNNSVHNSNSPRPLYSVSSMDYIPSSMILGFEDDDYEQISGKNGKSSNSNSGTNNNSNSTMGLNIDIDTTTSNNTVAAHGSNSTNANISDGSTPPYTPNTQAASNPMVANIPRINTNMTTNHTSGISDTGTMDTVYNTDNTAPAAYTITNPAVATSNTNTATVHDAPDSARSNNSHNSHNSQPDPPNNTNATESKARPQSMAVLGFAGKMLTKVKKGAATAAHRLQDTHTPTTHSNSSSLAHEIAKIGSDSGGSDYDSDGNKVVLKKIKDKGMFELFKRKASSKRQPTTGSSTHYALPDSDSESDVNSPRSGNNTPTVPSNTTGAGANHAASNTSHSGNTSSAHPNTHHNTHPHAHSSTHTSAHPSAHSHPTTGTTTTATTASANTSKLPPLGNRERTLSSASAVSNGAASPNTPNTPTPTNANTTTTTVGGLFGIVAQAMSPTNSATAANNTTNNTTNSNSNGNNAHKKHRHHHLNKQDSNGSNNNGFNGTLTSLGDTLNGTLNETMNLLNGKKTRRPSHTHSDTDYSALNSEEYDSRNSNSSSDSDSYRIEEGSDESHSSDFHTDYSSEYSTENEHTNIVVKKGHVLFTPEDIMRMFPENEQEQNKLEIQEEIRRLKTSSECSVSAATEAMKTDFQLKIALALQEIRMLRDALGVTGSSASIESLLKETNNSSGAGAGNGSNGAGSSDKMKRLSSKINSFGDKSSLDLTGGTKSSKRPPSRHSSRVHMNTSSADLTSTSTSVGMSGAVATTSIAHNMALKGRKKSGISVSGTSGSGVGDGKSESKSERSRRLSRPNSSSSLVSTSSRHSHSSRINADTTTSNTNANARVSRHKSRSSSPLPEDSPLNSPLNTAPASPEDCNNTLVNSNIVSVSSVFSPSAKLPKWPPTPPAPAPPTPIVVPRRAPSPMDTTADSNNNTTTAPNQSTTGAGSGAASETELLQMKADMQNLQGDMSEIKKMLGALLTKM